MSQYLRLMVFLVCWLSDVGYYLGGGSMREREIIYIYIHIFF